MPILTNADPIKLYSVTHAMDMDEHRYHLRGVHIERAPNGQGAVYVATDGHRMAVAYDEGAILEEWPESGAIIPLGKTTVSALAKRTAMMVRWDGAMITVMDSKTDHLAPCVAVDATFPNWRAIWPEEVSVTDPTGKIREVGVNGFNAKYLAAYAAVAKATDSGALQVRNNIDHPALVTLGGLDWWRGVLMPMRVKEGETPNHKPHWV
jgi:hypothetical protein